MIKQHIENTAKKQNLKISLTWQLNALNEFVLEEAELQLNQ